MKLVLDNSVCMRWCFGDGMPADLAYAESAMEALAAGSATVPAIWSLEVANVLVRAEHTHLIDEAHSAAFLTTLRKLRITTDPAGAEHALTDTLNLARRHDLSAYDAAYLELALREPMPLATWTPTCARHAATVARPCSRRHDDQDGIGISAARP